MAIRRFGKTWTWDENEYGKEIFLDGTPEYSGRCIAIETKTDQIMSDVWDTAYYMLVWDGNVDFTGSVKKIFVGYAYEQHNVTYSYEIDASDKIKEFAAAWQSGYNSGLRFSYNESSYNRREDEKQIALENPAIKGRMVEVYKGRKVPKGTRGMVFWIGADNYNNQKLGIATSDREDDHGRFLDVVWTAASNCRPINKFDGKV